MQLARAHRRALAVGPRPTRRTLLRGCVMLLLFVLGLDIANARLCCGDGAIPSPSVTVSSYGTDSGSQSTTHAGDNCFCCSRSIERSMFAWDAIEAVAFEIVAEAHAAPLVDLPPPYHPPLASA